MNVFSIRTLRAALVLTVALASFGWTAQAKPESTALTDALDSFGQVGAGQGWILFGGQIYWTTDDGAAWADVSPDSSGKIESVTFLDARRGWAVLSEPSGYSLASTADGGGDWQIRALSLSALAQADAPITKVFMDWQSESSGWLSFKLATSSNFDRRLNFVTADSGGTWTQSDSSSGLAPQVGDPTQVKLEAGMVKVSMSTAESGWAEFQSGDCSSGECTREVQLMSTRDGVHWDAIRLPNGQTSLSDNFSVAHKSLATDSDTKPYIGQGFDLCEIANLTQMQKWWNNSPYNAVNLYIGGISRGCSNSALSASFLSQLHAQGWRFIPTWVGLQASCSGYSHRMSSDPATANQQGKDEADAAITVAQTLGLTNPDGTGTVIYIDLEAYNTGNAQCRAAANAFIDGWTQEMQALGNLAGVYGASCGSAPTDWWSQTHVPDALWVANWYGNAGTVSYTPTASVWNAACLSNTLWPNHQRLRQYAGDHDETWGGVTLNIDSNVLDGPLTVPNGTGDASVPSAPSNPNPANGSAINRTDDTWLRWKTTGDSCSIHIWGAIPDLYISGNCSTYHLGPQGPGAYSWQVTAANGFGSTSGPVWTFGIKPTPPSNLSATPVSANRVNLNWTLSSDDPNVDGYVIFANDIQVGTVAAGVNKFQAQNLLCNTSYSFVVKTTVQGILSGASNTATATTASCAPVLVSPIGGAQIHSVQPTFEWQAVYGTSYYQIQISTSSTFSTLALNARTTATTYTPTIVLLPSKLYYWRVRGVGSFGTGAWASSSFVTPNPPPAPILLTPASNALITGTIPTFDWTDVIPPTGTTLDHYQIQMATDSTFTAPVVDENVGVSTYTPPTGFAPNTKYFWHVRAVNTLGDFGAWSKTWILRSAMLPPNLISPADGTTLLTLRPVFDWSDVASASGYTLQISKVNDFSTVLKTLTASASSLSMTSNLPVNSTLYWRVRANGANGPSLWSGTRSLVTPNPPGIPRLVSPANLAQINDLTPRLAWKVVNVPAGTIFDHYQVQVSTSATFASLVVDQSVSTLSPSEFTLISPLLASKKYYWRVMACNTDGACSAWSAVWSFKTTSSATP